MKKSNSLNYIKTLPFFGSFQLNITFILTIRTLHLKKGINGDNMRVGLGWWAHNAAYRWCILELYTWNLYNFTNQCLPNTFNKKTFQCIVHSSWISTLGLMVRKTNRSSGYRCQLSLPGVICGNKFTFYEVKGSKPKWHKDKRLSVVAFLWSK